ncbi:MAG TPA: DUF305 domain-containing protein [Amycolatopsis sp.]|uniref:DUF305 domain-containing protein n=1 Tax=Amycolatopsis sp. TaxID=37632 RepID=UPI002B48A28B|nr:DUF305 domain-containing protein [Amycolatopsis sp.]HKS48344.1 DUF305 domain-containing protein [Amycolatopsis sp.]
MLSRMVGGLMVTAMALTGCATAADDSASATENQADITFSQQMIPHHQQSIQLADLTTGRARSEKVKTLANEIKSKENAQIETMTGWLKSWHAEMPMNHDMPGMTMRGMLSASDVTAVQNAPAAQFDRAWLTLMARHLGNGVEMAKTVLSSGKHPGTKSLAQEIVTEQQAEITEINQTLAA